MSNPPKVFADPFIVIWVVFVAGISVVAYAIMVYYANQVVEKGLWNFMWIVGGSVLLALLCWIGRILTGVILEESKNELDRLQAIDKMKRDEPEAVEVKEHRRKALSKCRRQYYEAKTEFYWANIVLYGSIALLLLSVIVGTRGLMLYYGKRR